MTFKAAVFCHNGLGDGVNTLVLSNQLHLNQWEVDTYQNVMGSMQGWFPHLKILPYPNESKIPEILKSYEFLFVVHNDTDPFVQRLIKEGKKQKPDRVKIIYLYPSKNIVKEPYYKDCLVDPSLSIAENLRIFCKRVLFLPRITEGNGFVAPQGIEFRKHQKRVVIHPTSARLTRNWPKDKFLRLAKELEQEGYEPLFIPGVKEGWESLRTAFFPNLDELARFLYESGFLIGNDSGLGHLASMLGIPTLTVCRRKTLANMWAPSFSRGVVVTPGSWIPNIRGLRLRDRHWKKFISSRKVKRAFQKLAQDSKPK